uniref:Tyrosine--tRNA ligase n=1 Tax=Rhabditophanes sp. KR3021 TaxID=114890 RepID=A0AC35UHP7_9BILA
MIRLSACLRQLTHGNHQIGKQSNLWRFCDDMDKRKLISSSQPNDILKSSATFNQISNSLYAGFDPTADSLHVGHLIILTALLRSSKLFGCKPIALIGQATASIGDPSGRNTERPQISLDQVEQNTKSIKNQLQNLVLNSGSELDIVNNMSWYKCMSMLDYLKLSKEFRVGEMLRMGAIKNRLGQDNQSLSFTEFAYQTLQSYDLYHLSKLKGCNFQLGGSDQLGHITSGYDYVLRMKNELSGGLCLPLLTDRSGNKLGKSNLSQGGIWLDSEKTSPYTFYQFFRQLHDDIAVQFYQYLSLKDFEEISEIESLHAQNLGKWIVQDKLAEEMTMLVHGAEGLKMAKDCSDLLFNGNWDLMKLIDTKTVEDLFGASSFRIESNLVKTMGDIADKTRTDRIKGRDLMKKGGFKINGITYNDPDQLKGNEFSLNKKQRHSIVSWGKRKFSLIIWE